MKVGITGHQQFDDQLAWEWVKRKLEETVEDVGPHLVGISSLAIGADQLFAKLVLKHGGELHAILPFKGYEKTFKDDMSLRDYWNLLRAAKVVETLPARSSDEESYFAAGKRVVLLSDLIVAVWNGKKAAGLGGTGDAVEYALQIRKKVIHINPRSRELRVIDSA